MPPLVHSVEHSQSWIHVPLLSCFSVHLFRTIAFGRNGGGAFATETTKGPISSVTGHACTLNRTSEFGDPKGHPEHPSWSSEHFAEMWK